MSADKITSSSASKRMTSSRYGQLQVGALKIAYQDATSSLWLDGYKVPWSAHAPHWTRYEDEPRMQRLAAVAQEKGRQVFWSSALAVAYLAQHMLPAHGK